MGCGHSRHPYEFDQDFRPKKQFAVDRVIGKGGFGRVILVTKTSGSDAGKQYAMKALRKRVILERNHLKMVFNERNLLEQLRSPFLANMHYAFQDNGHLYLVLDACLGGDLHYRLTQSPNKRFTEDQARFYVAGIIYCLQDFHRKGVLHRDIKPENLLLDDDGYVKVTDLGISLELNSDGYCTSSSGTRPFMAPECFVTGHKHNELADFYSLGITLHQFLVGKRPFRPDNSTLRMLVRVATYRPPSEDVRARNVEACRQALLRIQEHKAREFRIRARLSNLNISPEGQDFVAKLLIMNPCYRLGAYGGIHELMAHSWFSGISWDDVRDKRLIPPFVPDLNVPNHSVSGDDAGINELRTLTEGQVLIPEEDTIKFDGYDFDVHMASTQDMDAPDDTVTDASSADLRKLQFNGSSSPAGSGSGTTTTAAPAPAARAAKQENVPTLMSPAASTQAAQQTPKALTPNGSAIRKGPHRGSRTHPAEGMSPRNLQDTNGQYALKPSVNASRRMVDTQTSGAAAVTPRASDNQIGGSTKSIKPVGLTVDTKAGPISSNAAPDTTGSTNSKQGGRVEHTRLEEGSGVFDSQSSVSPAAPRRVIPTAASIATPSNVQALLSGRAAHGKVSFDGPIGAPDMREPSLPGSLAMGETTSGTITKTKTNTHHAHSFSMRDLRAGPEPRSPVLNSPSPVRTPQAHHPARSSLRSTRDTLDLTRHHPSTPRGSIGSTGTSPLLSPTRRRMSSNAHKYVFTPRREPHTPKASGSGSSDVAMHALFDQTDAPHATSSGTKQTTSNTTAALGTMDGTATASQLPTLSQRPNAAAQKLESHTAKHLAQHGFAEQQGHQEVEQERTQTDDGPPALSVLLREGFTSASAIHSRQLDEVPAQLPRSSNLRKFRSSSFLERAERRQYLRGNESSSAVAMANIAEEQAHLHASNGSVTQVTPDLQGTPPPQAGSAQHLSLGLNASSDSVDLRELAAGLPRLQRETDAPTHKTTAHPSMRSRSTGRLRTGDRSARDRAPPTSDGPPRLDTGPPSHTPSPSHHHRAGSDQPSGANSGDALQHTFDGFASAGSRWSDFSPSMRLTPSRRVTSGMSVATGASAAELASAHDSHSTVAPFSDTQSCHSPASSRQRMFGYSRSSSRPEGADDNMSDSSRGIMSGHFTPKRAPGILSRSLRRKPPRNTSINRDLTVSSDTFDQSEYDATAPPRQLLPGLKEVDSPTVSAEAGPTPWPSASGSAPSKPTTVQLV